MFSVDNVLWSSATAMCILTSTIPVFFFARKLTYLVCCVRRTWTGCCRQFANSCEIDCMVVDGGKSFYILKSGIPIRILPHQLEKFDLRR